MNKHINRSLILLLALVLLLGGCSKKEENDKTPEEVVPSEQEEVIDIEDVDVDSLPLISYGVISTGRSLYEDENGDRCVIPAEFMVSDKADERTIKTGLVIIGPDGSEFVWVPTTVTPLEVHDFHSYYSGNSLRGYEDETDLPLYQAMIKSVEKYGGFYMGRYEASYASGKNTADYLPASKKIAEGGEGRIWVQFSPQDATIACQNLYKNNNTVQGFFPWGINWDTTLQWFIDSGNKTESDISSNSTYWGNYTDDPFSEGYSGKYTGRFEEAKANNIYDMAGNNWEWTQERYGSNYVMRGGGYNIMGGTCSGAVYPAAIRDPLPGNNHHPNVTFRIGLFIK